MKKISTIILLTLFLIPGILNAEEQKTHGGYLGSTQVSTPVMPVIPATKVTPTVSLPLAGQHPTPCPEKIERTIIKETKEITVLPKGMTLILSITELKKLKRGARVWKDESGKLYLLK